MMNAKREVGAIAMPRAPILLDRIFVNVNTALLAMASCAVGTEVCTIFGA